jgi:hypothetical protein
MVAQIDKFTMYGYTEEKKDQFFKTRIGIIPTYSFQVKKINNEHYWYAFRRDETGKLKTRYLGKCYEGLNNEGLSSFETALVTLQKRLNENFASKITETKNINYFIDLFVKDCQKRIESPLEQGLNYSTLLTHINGAKRFRKWTETQNIKLHHLKNIDEYRHRIKDYIEHLVKNREYMTNRKGDVGKSLAISTIRQYLKVVGIFHEWLADETWGSGGYLKVNPIPKDWVVKARKRYGLVYTKKNDRQNRLRRYSRDFYSSEGYDKMVSDCITEVRDVWEVFCKTGEIPREFRNQPRNRVGGRIVYFVSLFQLAMGFRVGEILRSFRSYEDFLNENLKASDSYSFWRKIGDTWVIEVSWKGKFTLLPTNDIDLLRIRTWVKPPNWKGKPSGNNGKEDYYDTHLVDVCMEMFSNSPFLFTAYKNSHKHYSYSQYNNNFKEHCIGKKQWDTYGIDMTHDLRHYFITKHIQLKTDPMLISAITRHSIITMMKFYKEENVDFQKASVRNIGIQIGKYKPISQKEN